MEPCCAVCFLGCTPKCTTPSVDVQSVPRFTPLDHHGNQVHQKENHQRLLLWEVSVMQQRPIVVHVLNIMCESSIRNGAKIVQQTPIRHIFYSYKSTTWLAVSPIEHWRNGHARVCCISLILIVIFLIHWSF